MQSRLQPLPLGCCFPSSVPPPLFSSCSPGKAPATKYSWMMTSDTLGGDNMGGLLRAFLSVTLCDPPWN